MNEPAIAAVDLVKRYGRVEAVAGVTMEVQRGEIFGFLGPNGAGKTTTINMLLGVTRPSSGSMRLLGQEYSWRRLDVRRRIGVVPENHPVRVWRSLTAREYLEFFAELFEVRDPAERIGALLEALELSHATHRRIAGFSRGMLQKLSFARALVHDPEILLLDEPISGLDPLGIKQVRDLILRQNELGKTVFISSHLLSEMERICGRVAIVSSGRVVAQGSVSELLEAVGGGRQIEVELERIPPGLADALGELEFVREVRVTAETLLVSTSELPDGRRRIAEYLHGRGLVPLGIRERESSLEDAFVTITRERVKELADARAAGGGAS